MEGTSNVSVTDELAAAVKPISFLTWAKIASDQLDVAKRARLDAATSAPGSPPSNLSMRRPSSPITGASHAIDALYGALSAVIPWPSQVLSNLRPAAKKPAPRRA